MPSSSAVLSPDQFLRQLFQSAPHAMAEILESQAADLANPPRTVEDILDELTIAAPDFASLMRAHRIQAKRRNG